MPARRNILASRHIITTPAAALVCDGKIMSAAQEENGLRARKTTPIFRSTPSSFCLDHAKLKPGELDAVVFTTSRC